MKKQAGEKIKHSKLQFLPNLQVEHSVDSLDCGTEAPGAKVRAEGADMVHLAKLVNKALKGVKLPKRN